jgi:hypothetical protein
LTQDNSKLLHYSVWNITLQGESQGQTFQRTGVLIITKAPITTIGSTNTVNPFDVFLRSGNPGAFPESGSIWFMTNNALIGNDAHIDMAEVSFDKDAQIITVKPDPKLSAVGINGFNAYSGLTADIYQVFGGEMQIQSQDNFQTISGSIDILGTGAIFHSNTPYKAQFSGVYSGEGSIDITPQKSNSVQYMTFISNYGINTNIFYWLCEHRVLPVYGIW